jgi:hypothetical protein
MSPPSAQGDVEKIHDGGERLVRQDLDGDNDVDADDVSIALYSALLIPAPVPKGTP